MTAVQFCYWLQGFFELAGASKCAPMDVEAMRSLNPEQCAVIRQHLNLVFAHDIDPKAGPASVQKQLDAIHTGPGSGSGYSARC